MKQEIASPDATKFAMMASLKKLMKKKPLNKISIRELTEDCNLNRQTFYYHFEDIYDLVKWMYQQEALSLLSQHDGILLWQDGLLQLFRYIQDNHEVCLCTYKSMGRDHLKRFFQSDIHAVIERTINVLSEDIAVPESYKELLIHYYVIALVGMIESWLLGEIDNSPEEVIAFIDQMIQDQIRGAKNRLEGISVC